MIYTNSKDKKIAENDRILKCNLLFNERLDRKIPLVADYQFREKEVVTIEKIRLCINGTETEVTAGMTILEAADEMGINIPRLCYDPELSSYGGCRLCVVEVGGHTEPVEACATPVTDGMEITTQSDRLSRMRQDSLQRLLVHHPLDCPICDKAGECRLQDLVFE